MKERRKRIAINTRFLIENRLEGIGWYTYEISRRLVKLMPEYDFYFFFDRPPNDKFTFAENVQTVVIGPQARHPFLWYVWFERSVKSALEEYEIDIFFSPDSFLCLGTDVPTLITCHDLAYIHYPKQLPFLVRKYYESYFPKYHEKATRITAVSHATKKDIIAQFKIPEEKIVVATNGCRDFFHPLSDREIEAVRNEYTDGKPFFIYLGSVHPRKNVPNLIRAFNHYKETTRSDYKLFIIGRKAWKNNAFDHQLKISPFKEDIIYAEDLKDEVYKIVASALAMVYVSLFEGFGLPILEAMSCGVPVICSQNSSMPEVAGDAALLVNPKKVKNIAQAMEAIARRKDLRDQLINSGFQQIKKFDWHHSASIIASVLEEMCTQNSSVG